MMREAVLKVLVFCFYCGGYLCWSGYYLLCSRGETEEEILNKCAEHAQKDHGMKEIPQELVERVREAIRHSR